MIVAAHQTMLAPQEAPLGSVEFTRGGGLSTPLYAAGVLSSIPSTWTISLWAKAPETPSYGAFFKFGNQNPGSGVGLGLGSDQFASGHAGTNLIALREFYGWDSFGSASPTTSWTHYAITVSGSTKIAYKNGTVLSTKTGTLRATGDCDIAIGCGHAETPLQNENRLFAGNITRFCLWSRVLTSSEVASDYADGKNAPTTTIGLEHYWPMNSANFTADTVGSATLTAGTGVSFSPDTPFA